MHISKISKKLGLGEDRPVGYFWNSIFLSLLFIFCIVVELGSILNFSAGLTGNFSFYFLILTLVTTVLSPGNGLNLVLIILSIAPAFNLQVQYILDISVRSWDQPGLDSAFGFILGIFLRNRRLNSHNHQQIINYISFAMIWVLISCLVSIFHNFERNASEFTFAGFAMSLGHLRGLEKGTSYFPLRDFYYFSLAVLFFTSLFQHKNELFFNSQRMYGFWGLFVGCWFNFVLCIYVQTTGFGFVRDSLSMGINGFWPDLHSFAGYSIIIPVVFLVNQNLWPSNRMHRLIVSFTILCSATMLLWSGSRFTIFLFLIFLFYYLCRFFSKSSGYKKTIFYFSLLFALMLFLIGLKRGYRGFSTQTIYNLMTNFSFENLNNALSFRPEIYRSALKMYSEMPFFGLGQSSFNLLSSIEGFSNSRFLIESGGENAHNYFLQTFVELGPIFILIVAAIWILAASRHRSNLGSFGLWGMISIGLSNLLAHSLLIREMLIFLSFFFAVYLIGSTEIESTAISKRIRKLIFLTTFLILPFGFIEVYTSVGKFPFVYGANCFLNRTIDGGWTSGRYSFDIPVNILKIRIPIQELPPDLKKRSLKIEYGILSDVGVPLQSTVRFFDSSNSELSIELVSEVPNPLDQKKVFFMNLSRCYVPIDSGLYYDSRILGIRISAPQLELVKPSH